MTPPSPLPPPAGTTATARPVMFGETWTDPNGVEHLAGENSVLLQFFIDGQPVASRIQGPDSAIALARSLTDAAGKCFRHDIDDTGKPLPAMERLARFNKAWNGL